MAIVEMKKLNVIGLNDCKEQLLKGVMDIGVVEINIQDNKLSEDEWGEFVVRDGDESRVYQLEGKISELESALEAVEKYDTAKKPLFKTRIAMDEAEFITKLKNKESIEQVAAKINEISQELAHYKAEESRLNTTIVGLTPWKKRELPLEMTETAYTDIFIGTVPEAIPVDEVARVVDEVSDKVIVYKVSSDDQLNYLSIVCLKEEKDEVVGALRQQNFNSVSFTGLVGKVDENIIECEKKIQELKNQMEELEKELTALCVHKADLQLFYDSLVIERDRSGILSSLVKTKSTFYFDGWFPEDQEKRIRGVLEAAGCYYEIAAREEDEDMPILLRQTGINEPFQVITDLYNTPSVKDIDPTPFLAPFYFIFFGLMLSDAGYGIILTLACFFLLKKFRLEGTMKSLIKLFMYCGISTTFWGILFGGWFGDFLPVAAKTLFNTEVAVNPVWFNPVAEPMTLLVFSLILGAIHLFIGMGLKAYMLIKNGKAIDAIYDVFLWYVLLIGLVLFGVGGSVSPMLATVGKIMSIVGAVGILLTGGRQKKGFGKVIGGLGSLYKITSYLSDVLSYSRLLALGLATGVIAQVVNTMGALAGGGFAGAVVMLIAFVIGHTFNIAINLLGAFVHSSRLQYVEFFGKFYEGGGEAFRPFGRKTKYVDILKEE